MDAVTFEQNSGSPTYTTTDKAVERVAGVASCNAELDRLEHQISRLAEAIRPVLRPDPHPEQPADPMPAMSELMTLRLRIQAVADYVAWLTNCAEA